MRRILLLLVGFLAVAGSAPAQLSVQVRLSKDVFVIYESIPVTLSIRNISGRTVELQDDGASPWLKFQVFDENNATVPALGKLNTSEPVLIPAGKSITHTVDILPLFGLRSRGSYRVAATITGDGSSVASVPVKFSLANGREIWTQTVGLAVEPGGVEEYRTYSLVSYQEVKNASLYVMVRAEPSHQVYSLIALGPFLPIGTPQTKVDKNAAVHVLFQNAPRSFGYVQVDSQAKIVSIAAYADFLSRPELVETEGVVSVSGGEQTYPHPDRVMTAEELRGPPPPAPPPPPKKKWWWPFGPKPKPAPAP